jgi:PAS domain-containing protein
MAEPAGLFPPVIHQDPLRVALDCLTEGFQIIDFDWHYVYVNPAAARHGRRDAAVLRKCMEQRLSHDIENQFTFPDGTTRWFELRVRPVPAGICVYSADIEARKRSQSFGPRLRQLFRGASDARS